MESIFSSWCDKWLCEIYPGLWKPLRSMTPEDFKAAERLIEARRRLSNILYSMLLDSPN